MRQGGRKGELKKKKYKTETRIGGGIAYEQRRRRRSRHPNLCAASLAGVGAFGVQGCGIDLAPLLCQSAAEIGAKEGKAEGGKR